MKNANRILAALLTVLILGSIGALAEESAETPAPAATVEVRETEKPTATPESKPAEQTPAATAEVAAEEPTLAPVEATEAPADPTQEPTATPDVVITQDPTLEPFTGSVEVVLVDEGSIYFDDEVTLRAVVRNANVDYTLRWEVNKDNGEGWKAINGATAQDYTFTVTEENAAYTYRVVVITEA